MADKEMAANQEEASRANANQETKTAQATPQYDSAESDSVAVEVPPVVAEQKIAAPKAGLEGCIEMAKKDLPAGFYLEANVATWERVCPENAPDGSDATPALKQLERKMADFKKAKTIKKRLQQLDEIASLATEAAMTIALMSGSSGSDTAEVTQDPEAIAQYKKATGAFAETLRNLANQVYNHREAIGQAVTAHFRGFYGNEDDIRIAREAFYNTSI